jgi:23S rRNA U2552 (ribose-2'-O)-methylase RlmE/FtsJ
MKWGERRIHRRGKTRRKRTMSTIVLTDSQARMRGFIQDNMSAFKKEFMALAKQLSVSATPATTTKTKIVMITKQYFKEHEQFLKKHLKKIIKKTLREISTKKSYDISTKIDIDMSLPEIQQYIEQEAGKKVAKYFTSNFHANFKAAIKKNLSTTELIKYVKSIIPLDHIQAKRASKYYDELLGSELSLPKIEKKFKQFTNRMLNIRAERIARTELSRLHNFGRQASAIHAEKNKIIKNTTQTWIAFLDGRNHQSSITNDGVTVKLGEAFPSGDSYPNEFNDRCVITMRSELT